MNLIYHHKKRIAHHKTCKNLSSPQKAPIYDKHNMLYTYG